MNRERIYTKYKACKASSLQSIVTIISAYFHSWISWNLKEFGSSTSTKVWFKVVICNSFWSMHDLWRKLGSQLLLLTYFEPIRCTLQIIRSSNVVFNSVVFFSPVSFFSGFSFPTPVYSFISSQHSTFNIQVYVPSSKFSINFVIYSCKQSEFNFSFKSWFLYLLLLMTSSLLV